ncbi:LysR family transcriptional regulator [Sphingomonas sp. LaA6.9]|uniref:LysR family transcriptional regulator n=1 Tax=Sphingomonas sp. LaA6.9 TaxID=2919914 RepID=UPI001F503F51|nr:LysR family transcriptional regulator [Sphingomonas sp. LaA6.9]MCJ8157607.1 LysR family transcriptional regulator [Sphingomonas sp. LaA6.9]
MRFDLNLLKNLAMLLHTRSVTSAAQKLNMSQPAMSRSLAELRQLFGDPLLVRTRGGMLLTRRAEELVGPVQQWLHEAERLVSPPRLDLSTLQRRFQIIAADYGLLSVLRPAMPAIMAAAPGVALDIRPHIGDVVARLATGEVDLVLSCAEPDRMLVHERHLIREEFVCLVRHNHPLAMQASAPTLDDILAWPHISVSIDEQTDDPVTLALAKRGLARRVVTTAPYFAGAQMLLMETDMVLALPASIARDPAVSADLHVIAAPAELGGFDYWLMWHTRSHNDPAIQWLIDLIAQQCLPLDAEGRCDEPLLVAAE